MKWIEPESARLRCPEFADELAGREAFEGLQPPPEIVGTDEVGEMRFELLMAVMVIALNGGFRGSSNASRTCFRQGSIAIAGCFGSQPAISMVRTQNTDLKRDEAWQGRYLPASERA